MGCSLVGSTATAAAFMATKDGGRTGPAPGAERKGRSAAEDGEARLFCLAMQKHVRAGGKETGAAIAGPGRWATRSHYAEGRRRGRCRTPRGRPTPQNDHGHGGRPTPPN